MSCKASWELKFVLELVFKCLVLSIRLSKYKIKDVWFGFYRGKKAENVHVCKMEVQLFSGFASRGVFISLLEFYLHTFFLLAAPQQLLFLSFCIVVYYIYAFLSGWLRKTRHFPPLFCYFWSPKTNLIVSRGSFVAFLGKNVQKHWCSPSKARTFLSAAWVKRPKGNVLCCLFSFWPSGGVKICSHVVGGDTSIWDTFTSECVLI